MKRNILNKLKKINPLYILAITIIIFIAGYYLTRSIEYYRRSKSPRRKRKSKSPKRRMASRSPKKATAKLVMYYAPWCGHCVTTKPQFNKLGKSQIINGKKVLIEKVNGDIEKEKVKGIKGYPTIILYNNGKKKEFNGQRTTAGFKKFLKDNI